MAKEHIIPITNGKGSKMLLNGSYDVTSNIKGYDNSTIKPNILNITNETTYNFTIEAKGTLTIHISDDGTSTGVPIIGATIYRTDSSGNTYGEAIITDDNGEAILKNVPYSENNAPLIYFIQTTSDGEHTFNEEIQNTSLQTETKTIEITNPEVTERTFNITDATYENLPIEDGNIILKQ